MLGFFTKLFDGFEISRFFDPFTEKISVAAPHVFFHPIKKRKKSISVRRRFSPRFAKSGFVNCATSKKNFAKNVRSKKSSKIQLHQKAPVIRVRGRKNNNLSFQSHLFYEDRTHT